MKEINIIGSGIAGLSAGCYLQMNGYKTKIFELNNQPGGLCTGWKRGDFIFDGCIHWLVGTDPKEKFYNLWNELIDMSKLQTYNHEEYLKVFDKEGNSLTFFTDVNKLEEELLSKAPDDQKYIKGMIKSIRKISKFDMDPSKSEETISIFEWIKMMINFIPYYPDFGKWGKLKAKDLANKLKTPLLKYAVENSFDPDMSFIFVLFTLAWMNRKAAGYPLGGSLNISKLIEKRYIDLGGKINYNNKIEEIITEPAGKKHRAKAIRNHKDELFESDITISAADGHYTLFKMLNGKFISKKIKDYYDNQLTFPSYIQFSAGVSRRFDDSSKQILFPLNESIQIDPETKIDDIGIRVIDYDPNLMPEGKSIIIIILPTRNYEYWNDLRNNNRKKYKEEKKKITERLIEILEQRYKGISKQIEKTDLSTPATVIRYTNNWKGSYEGWVLTPEVGFQGLKKRIPGLKDFYMIGQWIAPGGGLPTVLKTGRNVAQDICKRDKIKFSTEEF